MRTFLLSALFQLGVLLLAVGCGENAATEPIPAQPETTPEPSSIEAEGDAEVIYDEEGQLLASEQVVNGLVLPKGLTPDVEEETRRTFTTAATLEELRAYLGPRLDTGNVQQVGIGTMYGGATARSARGDVLRMDILLLPVSEGIVKLDIRDLPAPSNSPDPRSQRELVEQARRAAAYWD